MVDDLVFWLATWSRRMRRSLSLKLSDVPQWRLNLTRVGSDSGPYRFGVDDLEKALHPETVWIERAAGTLG